MAKDKDNTRNEKSAPRFNVGDRVIVKCVSATFEGEIIERHWGGVRKGGNLDSNSTGWCYRVSNNPTGDANCEWQEHVIIRRDPSSNLYYFPITHNQLQQDEPSMKPTEPGQPKKGEVLYDQMITQFAQSLYREMLCQTMSGLAANPAFADKSADQIAARADELVFAAQEMIKRRKAI